MNLQQIPKDNAYRNCFYHPEGVSICDYSVMEIRRVAELANETKLIEDLNNGLEPHMETAKKMFNLEGLSADEIAKKRSIGKTLNFSIVYGVSAFKLANDYGVSQKEAQGWIDTYFRTYTNIKKFLDKTRKFAITNGYTEIDNYGRRCYHPEFPRLQALREEIRKQKLLGISVDKKFTREAMMLEGDIERRSGNVIVSGSCATINKLAGIYLLKQGITPILAVHDENVVIGDKREEIKECMEKAWNVMNKSVTMPLHADYSLHWFK